MLLEAIGQAAEAQGSEIEVLEVLWHLLVDIDRVIHHAGNGALQSDQELFGNYIVRAVRVALLCAETSQVRCRRARRSATRRGATRLAALSSR